MKDEHRETIHFLGRPRGLRYTATALPRKIGMAVPRYRRIHDNTTALPRVLWHYRGLGASSSCLQMLGCLAGLARWLLYGFYRGPSTAHFGHLLPRNRAARYTAYRATAVRGTAQTEPLGKCDLTAYIIKSEPKRPPGVRRRMLPDASGSGPRPAAQTLGYSRRGPG